MKRRLFIFRPEQTLFILFLLVALLFGCGGGGGGSGGTNPPPNNPPPGGGNPGTPNTEPPSVVSAVPQGDAVSVSAFIEITFDKSMNIATFQGALEGLGNIGYEAVCVDADCKTIRLSRLTHLEYNFSYTLKLLPQVRDQDGNLLASPYEWSFMTVPFVPPLSFSRTTIDGLDGENAGECTALAVDGSGTVHIVYYSEEDGSPKHAFCSPNSEDCTLSGNWTVQFIEDPLLNEKRGRDINLVIDTNTDTLHVSYRDVDPPENGVVGDDKGVLKYARGVKSAADWNWTSFIVDDTENGVTDTYIAFNAGSVHIAYRKIGATSRNDVIAYTTCSSSCGDPTPIWGILSGEQGNDAGAPNHIVATDAAVYISYYLDGKMKYVTCFLPNDCLQLGNWTPIIVDDGEGGQFDVGTENSLAVDSSGVIHITYRDNTNGLLKYARCQGGCDDPVAIDAAGGSSQIKVSGGRLHVSYRDDANKDLKYATCALDCLEPDSWSKYTIDAPGEVGLDTYIAVDGNGTVHISYRAAGDAEDLKYAQGTP